MKYSLPGSWLLAAVTSLFGGVTASPDDPLPPSVPRPADDPKVQSFPSWNPVHSGHHINLTRVRHVHKCLQDWCDDRYLIWELGGKAICKTDHPDGENVVGWLCNLGYYQKACSAAMLNQAAKKMIEGMDDYRAPSPAGHIYYMPERSQSFVFGWDTYCNGSPSCGGHRDPTIVCENQINHYRHRPSPKPAQFVSIANAYGSVRHEGYHVEEDVESEQGQNSNCTEEEEFEKFKKDQAMKDISIAEQIIKKKFWPHTQKGIPLEAASEENIYYNPEHHRNGGR
ncbi:uncharacterized protein PODANS_5_4852 [Podospora anserina S mat+]|uniref:Podospora anserina S mat+ genomic DNA chromosome 5, supercontig 5 n=1 Tax=Podospora anserina (strain S / ATCC MYA-4624 / DSM 980 / FGSC 10383) TaxID=515849 RepID=B2AMQ4_PODAN|nr:uncharacterized protein PODANS_5_4852 [Podospora anserina S mat+]CAP65250.1 unnamed protein product [Podospora anserina S mat+]CDP29462.1 Putative protein of unknown function [Podospora anserina S mat+]